MKLLLTCVFLSAFLSFSQEKTRILFIFDASNSMNGKWAGNTKLNVAKKLLINAIDSLDGIPNLELGLRVYGHQSPITQEHQDCNDTRLEVPIGPNKVSAIRSKLLSVRAQGTTPIALSLEKAGYDFPDIKQRNIIVLITDGLEACENDPCAIARSLRPKGVGVEPFVIGIGLSMEYLKQLECLGNLYDAKDKASFASILKKIVQKAVGKTSAQINLNNIVGAPKETNVTVELFKSGTQQLAYTFTHTLNKNKLPDTLFLDHQFPYDILVHTIPPVEKKKVSIVQGIHNTIEIPAPQGFLRVGFKQGGNSPSPVVRVCRHQDNKTLNHQLLNERVQYIVGEYDMEIFTLPRIIQEQVAISQSITQQIDIPSPGKVYFHMPYEVTAQLFVLNKERRTRVFNLSKNTNFLYLQPGEYELVYRSMTRKSTIYTKTKKFRVNSNDKLTVTL